MNGLGELDLFLAEIVIAVLGQLARKNQHAVKRLPKSLQLFATNSDLYLEVRASCSAFSSISQRASSTSRFLASTSAFCRASNAAFSCNSSFVCCNSSC